MAPIDKIRQALGPEKAAAFDRVFAAFADRLVEIHNTAESAAPSLQVHFHGGGYVKASLQRDEVYR